MSNSCCHVSPFPLCTPGNALGTVRSLWVQTGAGSAPWAEVTVEGRRSAGDVPPAYAEGPGSAPCHPQSLAGSPWALLLAERLAVTSETSQGARRSGGSEKELAVISKGTLEAED